MVERLLAGAADVLTILVGDEAEGVEDALEGVAAAHPDLEIEVHEGGQPHYPLLFAAE